MLLLLNLAEYSGFSEFLRDFKIFCLLRQNHQSETVTKFYFQLLKKYAYLLVDESNFL